MQLNGERVDGMEAVKDPHTKLMTISFRQLVNGKEREIGHLEVDAEHAWTMITFAMRNFNLLYMEEVWAKKSRSEN